MKCLVLQTRRYGVVGLRHKNDVVDVDDELAKQFIEQGFMSPHKPAQRESVSRVKPSRGKPRDAPAPTEDG